jgi:mRNA interferase YafQ
MTREIVSTPRFKRSFRKFVRHNDLLRSEVQQALDKLRVDAFAPELGTHKLKGSLFEHQSCSCGYDCRIVFRVERDVATGEEYILLVDIGTHDEVYYIFTVREQVGLLFLRG